MKPHFASIALDAVDSWPHRWAMTSDRTPPKAADKQAEREAKLAQALRANLRRRKLEPKARAGAAPGKPGDGDSA